MAVAAGNIHYELVLTDVHLARNTRKGLTLEAELPCVIRSPAKDGARVGTDRGVGLAARNLCHSHVV